MTLYEIFTSGIGAIGIWFLWDLVREMKNFKTEAGRDISALKKEREDFKNTVKAAELSMRVEIAKLEQIHNKFDASITQKIIVLNEEMKFTTKMSMRNNESLKIGQQVLKLLNARVKAQSEWIKTIKVAIKDITIFKTDKKKKD